MNNGQRDAFLILLGVVLILQAFMIRGTLKDLDALYANDAELYERVEIVEDKLDGFTPVPVKTIACAAEIPNVPVISVSKDEEIHAAEEAPADEWQTMDVTVTAYCPCSRCCGKWADGITATGTRATAGRTCAVDPAILPLCAQIELDGKIYVAEDTGVRGAAIDLFFDTHAEALAWGVQHKTVRWKP